jgi:hypothetical protein
MSFGNKHNEYLKQLQERLLVESNATSKSFQIHNADLSFVLPIAEISQIVTKNKLVVLTDGLVNILNHREKIRSLDQTFVTSREIYLNLPTDLREKFYYYSYNDKRKEQNISSNILFIDAPLMLLTDKAISSLLETLSDISSFNNYYLNTVDIKTRFSSKPQSALNRIIMSLRNLAPTEAESLFEMGANSAITIIKDHFLFGFSSVELKSVMGHYKLNTNAHNGILVKSFPVTPFAKFELYKDVITEKSFYNDVVFNDILLKATKMNDGESIYHLLGHYINEKL